jgi:hypothetical protein
MKLNESLNEFMSDGSKFQLATPSERTWVSVWKRSTRIGSQTFLEVEGGYTTTTKNSHTAIVRVVVSPISLNNGAEDASPEAIIVYMNDFETADLASAAISNLYDKWKEY